MKRRSFLAACGAGSLLGFGGCLGGVGSGPGESPEPVTNREVPSGETPADTIPQFQGDPAHTGNLETSGPAGSVETYWRRTPHRYEHSQPVVVDDRVFVSFAGTLACLDRARGETLWKTDVGHDGAATPAVHDGTAYVTVWNGGRDVDRGLVAAAAESGEIQWRAMTDADITTSAAATADGVFVGGGYETTTVAAFDHDGTERWRHELGEYASTPAVADGVVYYGAGDPRVVAYEAVTGDRRWSAETDGETTAPPTVLDGTVVVGTRAGTLYAFDAADGTERWTADVPGTVRRSVAVTDDRIVVPAEEGLVALDWTGTEQWSAESIGTATAPVVAGDAVYVGDGRTLRSLSVGDGQERWNFETRSRDYTDVILQGIRKAPTVADDVVFVATQAGDVYALGEKST